MLCFLISEHYLTQQLDSYRVLWDELNPRNCMRVCVCIQQERGANAERLPPSFAKLERQEMKSRVNKY